MREQTCLSIRSKNPTWSLAAWLWEPEEGNSHFQKCIVLCTTLVLYHLVLSATVMAMTITLILQPKNYSSER